MKNLIGKYDGKWWVHWIHSFWSVALVRAQNSSFSSVTASLLCIDRKVRSEGRRELLGSYRLEPVPSVPRCWHGFSLELQTPKLGLRPGWPSCVSCSEPQWTWM